MTNPRITDAEIQSLRSVLARTTPGHWKIGRAVPDQYIRDAAEVRVKSSGERIAYLVKGPDCEYNEIDVFLLCLAHNHLGPILDELAEHRRAERATTPVPERRRRAIRIADAP